MRVVILVLTLCSLAACVSGTATVQVAKPASVISRAVHSGALQTVYFTYFVYPNCEIMGYPDIMVVTAPQHGSVSAARGEEYPNFNSSNVRHDCDRKLIGVTNVNYQSRDGYQGRDAFTVRVIYPDASFSIMKFQIDVF